MKDQLRAQLVAIQQTAGLKRVVINNEIKAANDQVNAANGR
ncbi:MAG: hypothetical protein ACLRZ6_01960 [Lachnospiraceae bacterium]